MRCLVSALTLLLALTAVPAAGQATDAGTPAVSADAVQAETGEAASARPAAGLPERAPQARTLRAHWHVFVAFAITWLLLFGYALSVGRRLGRLDESLQRLRATGP